MNSSAWKSPFQRAKKERQQPSARAHLGILEKKKDFIQRSKKEHKREKVLNSLKRQAELKNPNEFYFSMITDMKEKPEEFRTKSRDDFTKEQRLLLETRDMPYVMSKIVSQKKKIDKLKIWLPVKTSGSTKIYSTMEEAIEAAKKQAKEDAEKVGAPANEEEEFGEEEDGENAHKDERPSVKELRDEIKQRESILKKLQEVYDEMKARDDVKRDPNFKEFHNEYGEVIRVWKQERKK